MNKMEERKNGEREEGVGVKKAVDKIITAFFPPFLLIFLSPSPISLIQIYNSEKLLLVTPDYLVI
jgi:hypothetical protein